MDEDEARLAVQAIFQQDEELTRLTEAVQAIFARVTPNRLAVPTASACRSIAMYLMALRQKTKKPKLQVIKSGKDFRRDLRIERREVEWLVSAARARGVRTFADAWLREKQELLERIDQTLHNISWILPRLEPKDSYREPIRQIAVCAQQAWEEANDGRSPHSKNHDDPLCLLVVAAMQRIGQPCSAWTVSAVLRGLRRKNQ
jgi:hypothetical protein